MNTTFFSLITLQLFPIPNFAPTCFSSGIARLRLHLREHSPAQLNTSHTAKHSSQSTMKRITHGSDSQQQGLQKNEVQNNIDISLQSCVSVDTKRKYHWSVCYSDSVTIIKVPKTPKRSPVCIKHVRCATQTLQPRNAVKDIFPNSSDSMASPGSHVNYSRSDQADADETIPENASVENVSLPAVSEETSPPLSNPEPGDENVMVRVLIARLLQLKRREEEGVVAIAYLQRENDRVRTQLIQRSFGRGADHSDDDLYAHWSRQQTRLERMKALHERIRGHRAEVRRLLEIHRMRQIGLAQRSCREGM